MIAKILSSEEDKTFLGKNWVIYRFLSRHPQIKRKFSKSPDKVIVEASSHELIDEFYMLFESVKRDFPAQPQNRSYVDEHALGPGICPAQPVIIVSDKSSACREALENRE
ncbi:hypothetical protein K3495_g9618 [Podosphaera aphanis]|nr:hypothetical protein K3495_g9618 [Podosphaera aphanis]